MAIRRASQRSRANRTVAARWRCRIGCPRGRRRLVWCALLTAPIWISSSWQWGKWLPPTDPSSLEWRPSCQRRREPPVESAGSRESLERCRCRTRSCPRTSRPECLQEFESPCSLCSYVQYNNNNNIRRQLTSITVSNTPHGRGQ